MDQLLFIDALLVKATANFAMERGRPYQSEVGQTIFLQKTSFSENLHERWDAYEARRCGLSPKTLAST